MRLILLFYLLCYPLVFSCDPARATYPDRPIHIMVYTKPGGLIDVTARMIAQIAQKNYTKVPVIVENKKGAGGLVALSVLNRKPADGYTVLGMTSSVISKAIRAQQEELLNEVHYLARVVSDYEAVIVNREQRASDLDSLIEEARSKDGRQLWVGPSAGGTDHIFALKFWQAADIRARWIPYPSGGRAAAALMGQHASAYVGNPQDVLGRPELKVAAVAAPNRLSSFPNAPTFAEIGYPQLTGEVLWRGFAVKRGTPPDIIEFLTRLLRQVTLDAEWKAFCEKGNVVPVFDTGDGFTRIVQKQIERDRSSLKHARLLK